MNFINTTSDIEKFRNEINEVMVTEEVNSKDFNKVIENIHNLVTASNYKTLDLNLEETVWEAIDILESQNNGIVHEVRDVDLSQQFSALY